MKPWLTLVQFEILNFTLVFFSSLKAFESPQRWRNPVLGFFFLKYRRYLPDFNFRIMGPLRMLKNAPS